MIAKTLSIIFIITGSLSLQNCGNFNQGAYNSAQNMQHQRCYKMPNYTEQQQCLSRYQTSYKDYEKNRKE